MQVVILCGGLGTRLREETEFRPKPMVEIGGRPILWHIMKSYAHYGLDDFILCLGYKGEVIKEYFYNYELRNNDFRIQLGQHKQIDVLGNHNEVGWKVLLADTGQKTLKGERLRSVEKYVSDDLFMVAYGDSVSSINLDALVAFHHKHGRLATVTGVNPASRFGEIKVVEDEVVRFSEKPKNSATLANGGYFIFHRKVFEYLKRDDCFDLEQDLLEVLAQEGELMVYRHEGFWACMDTIRDTEYLNQLWANGKAEWNTWENRPNNKEEITHVL